MSVLCKSPSVIKGLVEGIACRCLCCCRGGRGLGWAGHRGPLPGMAEVWAGSSMCRWQRAAAVPGGAALGHPVPRCWTPSSGGLGAGQPREGLGSPWGGEQLVPHSTGAWRCSVPSVPAGCPQARHWPGTCPASGSCASPTMAPRVCPPGPLFCPGRLVPWVACDPPPPGAGPQQHPEPPVPHTQALALRVGTKLWQVMVFISVVQTSAKCWGHGAPRAPEPTPAPAGAWLGQWGGRPGPQARRVRLGWHRCDGDSPISPAPAQGLGLLPQAGAHATPEWGRFGGWWGDSQTPPHTAELPPHHHCSTSPQLGPHPALPSTAHCWGERT